MKAHGSLELNDEQTSFKLTPPQQTTPAQSKRETGVVEAALEFQ
jgi:hypothetical protein